jgi:hypothetical protein
MKLRHSRRWLGTIGALCLMGAEVLLALATHGLWRDVRDREPSTLADLVGLISATTALLLGLWLAAGLVAALAERAPGRPGALAGAFARHCAPALSRRWAALLLGAAVGAGVGGPAMGSNALAATAPTPPAAAPPPWQGPPAAPGGPLESPPGGKPGFTATPSGTPLAELVPVGPGWVPPSSPALAGAAVHLVSGPATWRTAPATAHGSAHGAEVVVIRGDSLWRIVRRALGPEASDAEVARAWPRWYAANRDVIGDDPALVLPGQVLRPPPMQEAGATAPAQSAGR